MVLFIKIKYILKILLEKYLEELNDKFIIDKVYFADDNNFFHYLLNELYLDSFIESLLPSQSLGLKELNEIISSQIIVNKIKRIG